MRIRLIVALAISILAFDSAVRAQSLVRVQGAGGRQTAGNAVVVGFSPDDRYVYLLADDAIGGDANGFVDVVRQDRFTGVNEVVSLGAGGAPLDSDVFFASLSANGRYLYLQTPASNFGFVDSNGVDDVYVRDLQTGTLFKASVGLAGADPDAGSYTGEVSSDGRFVAFSSEASNLVGGDSNGAYDVFVRDLVANTTQRVSVKPGGGQSFLGGDLPQISSDGRYVVFTSPSDDLVANDNNGFNDVFVRDRQTSTTTRVNLGSGGVESNGDTVYFMRASADARWIVFASNATNLAVGASGFLDIHLADRVGGTMAIASVGMGGQFADGDSLDPCVSDDGRYVTFFSDATNLDANDLDAETDFFWTDMANGVTRLASRSTGGSTGQLPPSSGLSYGWPALSGSGRLAGFAFNLQELVAGDTNYADALIFDAQSIAFPIESFCVAKVNSQGCTPRITSGGEPFASGASDSFFVSAHDVLNNKTGLFLWSFGPGGVPLGGGTLCVGTPLKRTLGAGSGGSPIGNDCSGTYSHHFSQAYMASKGIVPGATVYVQCWSRDPGFAAPDNIGLTDALTFTPLP